MEIPCHRDVDRDGEENILMGIPIGIFNWVSPRGISMGIPMGIPNGYVRGESSFAFNKVELAAKRRSASDRPSTTSTYQDYNNSCLCTVSPTATAVGTRRRSDCGFGDNGDQAGDGGEGPISGCEGLPRREGGAVPHALRSESAEERERADVGLGFRWGKSVKTFRSIVL
ncbi:hypothetical protein Syun_001670 [Stephania yunnanensis]|uniref:Uncharacterized protein n=1 Tax=Stephania yunnanensis TaxID=152371 RepID=A0AAP0LH48_9MAGN